MKIKRYIANSAHEAIQKVKEELGSEAIILNTRLVPKKGWLKWFAKPFVEVVAAIDEYNLKDGRFPSKLPELGSFANNVNSSAIEKLESRLDAMSELIKNLTANKDDSSNGVSKISAIQNEAYKLLLKNEVHDDIAKMLIEKASDIANSNKTDVYSGLEKLIKQVIGKPQEIVIKPNSRKIILFVGPTGVGKTTTLAKLAAILAIKQQKKVGLITADTFRIAAADQLRTYADIIGIPLTVIYSPKEVKGALNIFEERDVVLIDTAGRSLVDKVQHKEIEELIALSGADEVYVAISSNTSYLGYMNVIHNYNFLPDYKLIFTKMDEAASFGFIVNCCCMSGKAVSYITTGQNVPDDIELINPEQVVRQLLGRNGI